MALPTGVAPASVRLEDECLISFGHGSNLKLVSAAGLAPAVPRFQAGHVAATPRADGEINHAVEISLENGKPAQERAAFSNG